MNKSELLELVKAEGLASITELEEITGQQRRTLYNWINGKPDLLKATVLGAAELKRRKLIGL